MIYLGFSIILSGLYLEPFLARMTQVPVSYYTTSINALPALLGCLASIILAAVSEENNGLIKYKLNLYSLYPARAHPVGQSSPGCEHVNKTAEEILSCPTSSEEVLSHFGELPTVGRSALTQALDINLFVFQLCIYSIERIFLC